MGKKRTSSTADELEAKLEDDGWCVRLYRVAGKVAVELTECRSHEQPMRLTANFTTRAALERWLEAERLALERPMLFQAVRRKLDQFWTEQSEGRST
jgi:hypothetical protein